MITRIGIGYDVHQLLEGEPLWLGGVLIPHEKGLLAHSDGDVLLHAICDALLGAAKLRDALTQSGMAVASKTHQLVIEKGYRLLNLDSVIVAQRPLLKGYIPAMELIISTILNVDLDQVSIKATTTERLGFEGREEGISAQAVVLLERVG